MKSYMKIPNVMTFRNFYWRGLKLAIKSLLKEKLSSERLDSLVKLMNSQIHNYLSVGSYSNSARLN